MKKNVFKMFTAVVVISLLFACSSPEEKRDKFFGRGKALYESGEYVRAALELKTALQFDHKFADGYYYLAMSELGQQLYQNAYSHLNKTLELDPEHMAARLELARLLISAKQTDKALEALEAVLAGDPANTEARLLKAAALMAGQDFAGASAILTPLHKEGTREPRLFLMLAVITEQNGDSARAEKILNEGMGLNPESEALLKAKSDFLIQHSRYENALAPQKRLVDMAPSDLTYALRLAALYWKLEDRSAADVILADFTERNPDEVTNWTRIASFYLSADAFSRAEEILQSGIGKNPGSFDLRFALAEVYADRGDIPNATAVLEHCLSLSGDAEDPNILKTKTSLAKICLMTGETDRAGVYVDEVLEKDPASVDGHYLLGRIYLIERDGKNAVSSLRTVVSDKPDYLPGYLRLAEAYALDGNLELAVDTLKSALKISPDSEDLQQALLRAYLMKNDFESAQSQLEAALSENPKDTESLTQLGDLMLVTQAVDSAQKRYQEVIAENPEDAAGYIRLARTYSLQEDSEKATEALLAGHRANRGSDTLLEVLVKTFLSQDDTASALALCQERIQENPEDWFALDLLGQVHVALKAYEEAESCFTRAIEIQPDAPEAYINLAKLYLRQGRRDEAVSRYRDILRTRPDNATAYLSLGALFEQSDEPEKAREIYETALEHLSTNWEILNNLAYLMGEHSQGEAELKEALSLAHRAQNLKPGASEVRDTLGWIYYKMGDLERAQSHLESALSKETENPIYNYHMAALLHAQGNPQEARQKLEKALLTEEEFSGKTEARALMEEIG